MYKSRSQKKGIMTFGEPRAVETGDLYKSRSQKKGSLKFGEPRAVETGDLSKQEAASCSSFLAVVKAALAWYQPQCKECRVLSPEAVSTKLLCSLHRGYFHSGRKKQSKSLYVIRKCYLS